MADPTGSAWFRAGTRVMTLRGEVPIESVHTGDRAVTLSGNGSTLKPVAAVLQMAVDLDRHPDPQTASLIRIRAGAVEPGMPVRDLLVSPGHALSLEDEDGERVLVPALYLVNGATILREPAEGVVAYWQVALEEHDILMADGMAAEGAVQGEAPRGKVVPWRRAGATGEAATAPPNLLPGAREQPACARLVFGAAAAALHARLLAVAQAAGFSLTTDPELVLTAGGKALAPLSESGGEYVFLLPSGTDAVGLRSRTIVPIETNPVGGDTRRLGVAVARLVHDGTDIPLDGPACRSGFLGPEHDGTNAWRWTTGSAAIDLAPRDGETTLELHLHMGWARYWTGPA